MGSTRKEDQNALGRDSASRLRMGQKEHREYDGAKRGLSPSISHELSVRAYILKALARLLETSFLYRVALKLYVHMRALQVQCCQILCRRARVPTLKFAGTAETAFRLGPEPFRKYAATFALAVNIIVCFVQYETAIVYELYIATSFEQVR